MDLELTVVDAFTDRPFSGNPAAVAVLDTFLAEPLMQSVAGEMAVSETAFCVPRHDGDHDLRWFSPTIEIDLCGHATLATTHVLGGHRRFHTRGGVLACRAEPDGMLRLDFPADTPEPTEVPAGLPGALGGATVRSFARCRADALIELSDAHAVRSLQPDLSALSALARRGVIVTAAGDRDGIDCVSRFFAPNAGVPEDPATGSAHCALAVWWGERLDKDQLVGEQASPRGGVVWMTRRGERVELGGRAVTVSKVVMTV